MPLSSMASPLHPLVLPSVQMCWQGSKSVVLTPYVRPLHQLAWDLLTTDYIGYLSERLRALFLIKGGFSGKIPEPA